MFVRRRFLSHRLLCGRFLHRPSSISQDWATTCWCGSRWRGDTSHAQVSVDISSQLAKRSMRLCPCLGLSG
jgi:hypothetical protein